MQSARQPGLPSPHYFGVVHPKRGGGALPAASPRPLRAKKRRPEKNGDNKKRLLGAMIAGVLLATVLNLSKLSASTDDVKTVASLDTEYQEAVKKNDAVTMNRLLAGDFILVVGSGKIFSKADLLDEARGGKYVYEHQEDTSQTVRVWGDTAIVTAKLWAKGMKDGKPFDYTLWFSDTYVRSSSGWRYVFGQASLPLPKNP